MTNIKQICVFASSSNELSDIYFDAASKLGTLIATNGYNLVYGGSRRGLMYACAKSVKDNGGKVFGVMPEKIAYELKCANPDDCDEFFLTQGMRDRKAKLDEISDAIIAIAGGYGTLEELSEMIVQKQLGYNNKPIVILNTEGFYDNLLKFFETMIEKRFANSASRKIYYVANTPQEAVDYIKNYVPEEIAMKFIPQ